MLGPGNQSSAQHVECIRHHRVGLGCGNKLRLNGLHWLGQHRLFRFRHGQQLDGLNGRDWVVWLKLRQRVLEAGRHARLLSNNDGRIRRHSNRRLIPRGS